MAAALEMKCEADSQRAESQNIVSKTALIASILAQAYQRQMDNFDAALAVIAGLIGISHQMMKFLARDVPLVDCDFKAPLIVRGQMGVEVERE